MPRVDSGNPMLEDMAVLNGMISNYQQSGLQAAHAQAQLHTETLRQAVEQFKGVTAAAEAANAPEYYGSQAKGETATTNKKNADAVKANLQTANTPTAIGLANDKTQSYIDTQKSRQGSNNALTSERGARTALLQAQGYGDNFKNTYIWPMLQQQAGAKIDQIKSKTAENNVRTQILGQQLGVQSGVGKLQRDLQMGLSAKKAGVLPELIKTDPANPIWKALNQSGDIYNNPVLQAYFKTGDPSLAQAAAEGMVSKVTPRNLKTDENPIFGTAVQTIMADFVKERDRRKAAVVAPPVAPPAAPAIAPATPPAADDAAAGIDAEGAGDMTGAADEADASSGASPTPGAAPVAAPALGAPGATPTASAPATPPGIPHRTRAGVLLYKQADGSFLGPDGLPIVVAPSTQPAAATP